MPSWQLLADEVEAQVQVVDLEEVWAEHALVMMNLRAQGQSHTPIDRDALQSLAQSSPRSKLRYFAVFGTTVDAQILVHKDSGIITCWVYPKDSGVVLAEAPR